MTKEEVNSILYNFLIPNNSEEIPPVDFCSTLDLTIVVIEKIQQKYSKAIPKFDRFILNGIYCWKCWYEIPESGSGDYKIITHTSESMSEASAYSTTQLIKYLEL